MPRRGTALDAGLATIGADPATVWLASTDADSVVARDWITTHVAWADAGLDAVAGLVDVAWGDDQRLLARRFAAARTAAGTGIGHRHVHGANLGVRGDRWLEVGGCGAGDDGEDGELWRRLHAAGVTTLGVTDLRVRTSGRLHGRASRGFSGYLRALDAEAEVQPPQRRVVLEPLSAFGSGAEAAPRRQRLDEHRAPARGRSGSAPPPPRRAPLPTPETRGSTRAGR